MTRKERNKEVILTMIVSLVVFYAAMYLLIAFAYWDIFNPFKWVLEIPTYHPSLRVVILAGFALVVLISYFIVSKYVDYKISKKKKEEHQNRVNREIQEEFFPK